MNNWNYANDIPTSPWKGVMSLPRNLTVKKVNDRWVLLQQPIAALQTLRGKLQTINNITFHNDYIMLQRSQQCEILLTLEPGVSKTCGVKLASGHGNDLEIGYDQFAHKLYIDRRHTAHQDFNKNFAERSRYEAPLFLQDKKLTLHIFFDHSVVEVFANDGEVVMSAQLFPDEKDNLIRLFGTDGAVLIDHLQYWPLKSAW